MSGSQPQSRSDKPREWGDFPTPPALVDALLEAVGAVGSRFARVLEPTCGRGNFLEGLLRLAEPPSMIRGFEIQPEHAEAAMRIRHPSVDLVVETADLFRVDLARDLSWPRSGPMLVVGNLPWVTTAAVGASGGSNGPERSNVRGLRGIEAMTGESNFDVSEALWLKLIRELARERPTIALLCKTAVARNVLRSVESMDLPVTSATIWKIDAHRWFRASVDACLLQVEVGPGPIATEAQVFGDLSSREPVSRLGFGSGRMIADLEAYRRSSFVEGSSPLTWRQGVKHDAAGVMELTLDGQGRRRNKRDELVEVEDGYVFPLQKGTDLAGSKRFRPARWVVVTQRRLGEDTRALQETAPRLWSYLQDHLEAFDRRKSSIYRRQPAFSMFGVGDYSFAPFKVAVSGLHKSPRFRAIGPVDGQPPMLDDTCYFLPCRTSEQAGTLAEALNGPVALDLIRGLSFPDAKRPITKAILQRIDLKALLDHDGRLGLWEPEWESAWSGRTSKALAPLTV